MVEQWPFKPKVVDSILTPLAMMATMWESRPRVPTVYFSIGDIELLSLSARETLGGYAGDSSANDQLYLKQLFPG